MILALVLCVNKNAINEFSEEALAIANGGMLNKISRGCDKIEFNSVPHGLDKLKHDCASFNNQLLGSFNPLTNEQV